MIVLDDGAVLAVEKRSWVQGIVQGYVSRGMRVQLDVPLV